MPKGRKKSERKGKNFSIKVYLSARSCYTAPWNVYRKSARVRRGFSAGRVIFRFSGRFDMVWLWFLIWIFVFVSEEVLVVGFVFFLLFSWKVFRFADILESGHKTCCELKYDTFFAVFAVLICYVFHFRYNYR